MTVVNKLESYIVDVGIAVNIVQYVNLSTGEQKRGVRFIAKGNFSTIILNKI